MNYIYYIVNKENMSILFAEQNFVEAYNRAQTLQYPCAIFQGCFLTETTGTVPQTPEDFEVSKDLFKSDENV